MLRLGRDSFSIRFSGLPDGVEVHEYARTTTGYRYTASYNLGPAFHRQVAVDLDSTFHVTRVRSTSQLGSQRGESDVSYSGRRARGTAVPLQAAPGRVSIDTLLPEGSFDGVALYPRLLSRRWTLGQRDTLVIFDTDEMSLTRQVFQIVAAENITAAGAEVRALRAELSTTQLPVTLWLSETHPHRLLKIGSANGETVLVR